MKMKTSRAVILTIIAVLLAIYILFPFALVVLNSFKTQAAIVQNPISAAGASFKQFDVNLALTNGGGTVRGFMGKRLSNGTQMIALNIYNTAFARDQYGYAQAKAILFFIILACVSLIQVRISNKREVEM